MPLWHMTTSLWTCSAELLSLPFGSEANYTNIVGMLKACCCSRHSRSSCSAHRLWQTNLCETHHFGGTSAGKSPPIPDLKTLVWRQTLRDLFGSDRLNQNFVNPFGKGLNVTDVHLYVKVRFKHPLKLKPLIFLGAPGHTALIFQIIKGPSEACKSCPFSFTRNIKRKAFFSVGSVSPI